MKRLDILIEKIESEINYCNNPPSYENNEFYLRCKLTVSILRDVLEDLKEIKELSDGKI